MSTIRRGEHQCRFCGGQRENDGETCLGCGSPLDKCQDMKPKCSRSKCPGCTHTGPHQTLEQGRFRCLKCTAVFEHGDFGYLDDRPHVNVEKKERLEAKRRTPSR